MRTSWARGARGADLLALALALTGGLLLALLAYREPRGAALTIDAPPVLLPLQGFHEVERFADRPSDYRWSRASAELRLPNPGGPALLRVVLAGGSARTVELGLSVNGRRTPIAVAPEPRTYLLALPASAGERITVALDAPAMVQNSRELGVAVGALTIAGGGAAPARVLLALAFAGLGLYALFRQAGMRPALAGGAALLAQALAVLGQAGGLWAYALLGPILLLLGAASLAAVAAERIWPPAPAPEQPWAALGRRDWLVVGGLLAAALLLRLPWLAAPDPVGDLELSARRMGFLHADGLAGAFRADGDYMPLRLYWLLGFSKLAPLLGGTFQDPIAPATLVLIKLPGLLADLATVGLIYAWGRRWLAARSAALLAGLYSFAPPVWMVVAWWGQVDAILLLPLLLMVALIDRAGGRWAWAGWVAALLIKTQAIIFAPLLYVATLRRHGCRGLAANGALAAGLLGLGMAPLALAGQGAGMAQAYLGAVGRFPQVTNRAYNLWFLLLGGANRSDRDLLLGGLSYRAVGILLVAGAALLVGLALLWRADGPLRAGGAAVTALAFFLLPTQIHERYLFFTLAFLVLWAASDRRLVAAYLFLATSLTLNILATLGGFYRPAADTLPATPLPLLLAGMNLLVFLALLGWLLRSSWVGAARR